MEASRGCLGGVLRRLGDALECLGGLGRRLAVSLERLGRSKTVALKFGILRPQFFRHHFERSWCLWLCVLHAYAATHWLLNQLVASARVCLILVALVRGILIRLQLPK